MLEGARNKDHGLRIQEAGGREKMLIINVILVDIACVALLLYIYKRHGLGEVLPYYIFMMIFFPSVIQLDFFGFFDFTVQRIVTITMLVLALLSLNQSSPVSRIELKYLIVVLLIWSFLSNVNSIVLVVSLKRMMAYVLEYFTLFFILSKYVTSTTIIRKIFVSVQIAIFLACILGFIEYLNGWSLNSLFPSEAGRFSYLDRSMVARQGRLKSIFPHPILFGSAIAMTLPITFHFMANTKNRIIQVLLWINVVFMMFCLYKTTSRGPWIASGIAIVMLFVMYPSTRRFILTIGVTSVLILFIRPGIWSSLSNILLATFDPTTPLGSSYQYRYALVEVIMNALDVSIGRTLMGYGQDAFYYLGLEAEFDGRIYQFLSMDSAWAKILFELGYVGFVISVVIFVRALMHVFMSYYKYFNTIWHQHFTVYAIMMVVFYFMMTNVAIYGWGPNGYLLWMAIALSCTHAHLIDTAMVIRNHEIKRRTEATVIS